jgi:hypothetical protein
MVYLVLRHLVALIYLIQRTPIYTIWGEVPLVCMNEMLALKQRCQGNSHVLPIYEITRRALSSDLESFFWKENIYFKMAL